MSERQCFSCQTYITDDTYKCQTVDDVCILLCVGCYIRLQAQGKISKILQVMWDHPQPTQPHPTPTAVLQTPIDESYTAIPPLALAKVAAVMASGTRKYGVRNWDKISVADHLDHAIRHGYLYVMGDTIDEPTGVDHLANMACRALMALEVEMIRQQEQREDVAKTINCVPLQDVDF